MNYPDYEAARLRRTNRHLQLSLAERDDTIRELRSKLATTQSEPNQTPEETVEEFTDNLDVAMDHLVTNLREALRSTLRGEQVRVQLRNPAPLGAESGWEHIGTTDTGVNFGPRLTPTRSFQIGIARELRKGDRLAGYRVGMNRHVMYYEPVEALEVRIDTITRDVNVKIAPGETIEFHHHSVVLIAID